MNVIFIAPPAAGKGTQASILKNRYNFNHISTGDLIREAINSNGPKSEELKKIIEQGKLVSDEFVLDLIKERINTEDNYLFDGFPRTLNQAKLFDEMLEELGKKVDYVIYLTVDKELAKKRIVGRLSCPSCGRVYNDQIESSMPKVAGYCDDCNTVLTKRFDDNEETFNVRYNTYMDETAPILDYYEDKLYEVDSAGDKLEIANEIAEILGVSNDNN